MAIFLTRILTDVERIVVRDVPGLLCVSINRTSFY